MLADAIAQSAESLYSLTQLHASQKTGSRREGWRPVRGGGGGQGGGGPVRAVV